MASKRNFSEEEIDRIIEGYLEGKSGRTLATTHGVVPTTIYRILRKRNVDRRSYSESGIKHPLNHSKFDELTEESLYWAGFIAADGCIQKPRVQSPTMSIALSIVDIRHLEKIKGFLESGHTITKYYNKVVKTDTPNACRFSVGSTQICNRLEELGVKGPELSDDVAMSRDFWRGVVDGDGHLAKRTNTAGLSLVGFPYILEPYQRFLRYELNIESTIKPHSSIYKIDINGKNGIRAIDYLYRDSKVSLDRKQKVADDIMTIRV